MLSQMLRILREMSVIVLYLRARISLNRTKHVKNIREVTEDMRDNW